jgi:hypothetical protein
MADNEKTYLINFQDNLEAYAQRAADAKAELDKLKKANEDLLKGGKASAAQIEASNAALRTAQQEYKNAQKNVELATKANKAHKDSHEELLRRWQLAQTELKRMGDGMIVNADGTRTLSAAYIEQSKVVANAKKAINDFNLGVHDGRYNTGLYSEALDGAMDKFSMMPGPLGNVANSVKGLNKQFLTLLTNPIVLLIAAITAALVGLFKAFKSTDSGSTQLAARMEQLRAIFDVVRQRAIALLGAIGSLLKGDFKKAGEQFKQTFTGIGDQIKEATKAAYDYQMAIDSIEDSQNNFISRAADVKNQIAKLEFTAADRSKSTAERQKALKEALALSEEEKAYEAKLKKDRLDAEAKYLAEKAGLRAEDVIAFVKMSDEEQANADESVKTLRNNNEAKFKEIEQFYADWINADTAFYEENKRNISKLSQFEADMRKERAEAAEAARVEQLRKQAEADVEMMKRQAVAAIAQAKSAEDVQVASGKKQEAATAQLRARQAEALMLDYENAQALLETTLFGQLEAEQNKLNAERDAKIAAAQAVGASVLDIEERYARASTAIENAKRDAKLELAQGAAESLADIFGETTAAGKAAAVAATTIDTFRSAQAAFSGMVQAIPGPVGIAAGIVAAAGAVAIGLANVKKILAVKTPKGGGGSSNVPTGGSTTMGQAAQHVTAKPVGPTTLQPLQSAQTVNEQQQQSTLTADAIAEAVGKLPAPKVTVEDINAKADEARKVEVGANV